MKASKGIFLLCLIFSASASIIGCGKKSPSKPTFKVDVNNFKEELEKNALTLESFKIGMKRLVIEKNYFIIMNVKCPYTIKNEQEILGIDNGGLPIINGKTSVTFENKDPNCLGFNGLDKIDFPIANEDSILEMFDNSRYDMNVEKIGDFKYRIKGERAGFHFEEIYDLKKPFFLNPIEFVQNGGPKRVITEI